MEEKVASMLQSWNSLIMNLIDDQMELAMFSLLIEESLKNQWTLLEMIQWWLKAELLKKL